MKCKILHESNGRMRLHAEQTRMTLRQADILEAYLRQVPGVTEVKIYDRTCDAVVLYRGARTDLIRALDEVEGIVRYRISSIEPNLITDEAIDFVACSRRFAPHFHIPLQSGSDEVLKLMRRRYDTTLFRHKIEKIKEVMPHAFIGVDVIVGTRGETDTCFEEARTFIESLDISQLHVFSYSERPGTQALKIDHVVDPKTKHARSQQLLDISDRKLHAFYEAHIGQKANVLFEQTRKGGMMHGFTENYIKVEIPYDHSLVNETRQVILEGWNEDKTALVVKIIE